MLETLDYTICIGSTPTFLYFDLYFNTAYIAHYILFLSDEGPMLETLDYIYYPYWQYTPTFLYFDFYLYSAYAAH